MPDEQQQAVWYARVLKRYFEAIALDCVVPFSVIARPTDGAGNNKDKS